MKMHTALTAHQEKDWATHGAQARRSLKTIEQKLAYARNARSLAPVKGTGRFKKGTK
jgi:hypothetical protein